MRLGTAFDEDDNDNDNETNNFLAAHRQRRILRSALTLIMLMILLEDPQVSENSNNPTNTNTNTNKKSLSSAEQARLKKSYSSRSKLDSSLFSSFSSTPRYTTLLSENHVFNSSRSRSHHYPRNVTGVYNGVWSHDTTSLSLKTGEFGAGGHLANTHSFIPPTDLYGLPDLASPGAVPAGAGIYILGEEEIASISNANANANDAGDLSLTAEDLGIVDPKLHEAELALARQKKDQQQQSIEEEPVVHDYNVEFTTSLIHPTGRSSVNLFMKHIPNLPSLSLVRGVVRFYDGFSAVAGSRDLHLYATGVVFHDVGKVSMVANSEVEGVLLVNDLGGKGERKGEGERKGKGKTLNVTRLLQDVDLDLDLELDGWDGWEPIFYSSEGHGLRKLPASTSTSISSIPLNYLFNSPSSTILSSTPSASRFAQNARKCAFEINLDIEKEPIGEREIEEQEFAKLNPESSKIHEVRKRAKRASLCDNRVRSD